MPEAASTTRPQSALRDRLVTITFVRVLIITLLMGSAIAVNLNDVERFSDPSTLTLWALVVATYVATVAYAIWIRVASRLSLLAFVQITGDALLTGGLVFVTQGTDSIFLFIFFLAIIPAATLRLRRGALYSASVCSVVYTFIVLSQRGSVPYFSHLSLLLGGPTEASTYTSIVHLSAFYAVAILSGHLAETLGRFGNELEMRWTDIRELRALNDNIIGSITDGLCTLDLADRIISFNPGAARIMGLSAIEVLGRPCAEALPELAGELEGFRRARWGLKTAGNDLAFQRPSDGRRLVLSVSVTPLRDSSGLVDGHLLQFTDITEIRHLQEIMLRQQRLAAIGQLSAGIAHEIRNPLASISGSLQILKESVDSQGPERRLMDIALRETDRLNGLIEDFLAYARPSKLHFERVDLAQLLSDVVGMFRQDAALCRDLEIGLTVMSAPPIIPADADGLRQVLWNLLRNAAEAIEGPGVIEVTLHWLREEEVQGGLGIEIGVGDSGPGLSPQVKTQLFEPFFTTKTGGTGLGLSIASRIVEVHGGMMFAENREDGKGAVFRIRLPETIGEHGADTGHR